jgi:hypothetical protein
MLFYGVKIPKLRQLYFLPQIEMLVLHQILKKITQYQRLEIKSRKEKFGPQCKIYKDKTSISVRPKKL